MNNVNDLNRTDSMNTHQNQQAISLSALNNENANHVVSINATNGLSGVNAEETTRPVVRINPNRKNIERRPVSSPDQMTVVDPSELNTKPQRVAPVTPRDIAMGQLDAAVRRKQDEFKQFVQQAQEEDKNNREMIEAGIETANDEMQYMPNDLHEEMKDSDKVSSPMVDEDSEEDFFDNFDDSELSDEPTYEAPATTNTVFDDPFSSIDNESDDSEDEEEVIEAEIDDDQITIEETVEQQNTTADEPEDADSVEDDFSQNAIKVTSSALKEVEASSSDFDIDEADFEDVTADTEENLTDDQILEIAEASEKNLRSEILHKIVQSGKKMNISQLNVSNKVINIKDALKGSEKVAARTATWPLSFAGRPYVASALKGPEIALMSDSDTSADDGVGLSMAQARIMFEHDANPYRPATLEAWAKTIPFADIENIFAALYIASIKGANYVPMACPKASCQYAYLSDDTDIDKMVKFESDEAKKRFEDIKSMKLTAENTGSYESVISVINDRFAVGLKLPSIFTILYEYNSLNAEFVNKYTAMVSIIQYIDYMYLIDPDTETLQPIGWKSYPGDNTKTFKSKIATYAKILKELDDTDFSIMMALINSMVTKAADTKNVSFEIPAAKCPKCGAEIAARPINARGLVFMRQRLVELATTPTGR